MKDERFKYYKNGLKNMRKLVLSLGLGLAGLAYAGDSIITSVIDRTFQRDVVDYGDAVVLFYGSATNTEKGRITHNNNKQAFEAIAEMSQGVQRNGHPIKFVTYDVMQHVYQGLTAKESLSKRKDLYEVDTLPFYQVYRDGELFDTMPCGLNDEGAVTATINNMGEGLIPSVFEGPLDGIVYGYEGTCKLHPLE